MNMITKSVTREILPKIRSNQGVTLVELMIVVLLIAVIAAVALPSYTNYIIRSNRGDAADQITAVMFQQERFQTRNRRYTDDLTDLGYGTNPLLSEQGLYNVSASNCAGEADTNNCVLLMATPVAGGAQVNDGPLTLDSRGNRTGPWETDR
jgi:prepilin-type N-terminal cleavage/methylation domain